jgi:hypothetical protein
LKNCSPCGDFKYDLDVPGVGGGGPVDLTSDVTGVLPVANGGTNSSTALNNNRIIISSGSAIVESAAITASRALQSNSSGIPVASSVTATQLGYVSGVTSAIQTQLNGKQATGNYVTALTGDVTATGPGSVAATIANNAVTNAKLAQMATLTLKGNNTGSTANAADLTVAQVQTMLASSRALFALTNFSFSTSSTPTATGVFTIPANTFTVPGDTIQVSGALIFIGTSPVTATYSIEIGGEFITGTSVDGEAYLSFALTGTLNNASELLISASMIGFDSVTSLVSVISPVGISFDPTISNDFELFMNNSDNSSLSLLFQEFSLFIPAP